MIRSFKKCVSATGLAVILCAASGVQAQPAIFSFENASDITPWTIGSTQTLVQSSFGATDGASALLIDNVTSGFKNNIATTPNFGPATEGFAEAFAAFDLAGSVIGGGGTPKLEFDLAWDFSAATDGFIQLGIFVNSSTDGGGGFKGYGTGSFINGNSGFGSWPALGGGATADGAVLTSTGPTSVHVAIPFGPTKTLTLSNASTFFDLGFQSNGSWGGTVDFAIDNIKFTGVPVFEEHTLFSWETPDNPSTPSVDERFEGWAQNPTASPATPLSITSTGATDGSSALQIDRTPLANGFSWGSVYALDATTTPADQAKIDDLVDRVNAASRIAIDITFQDQFPISPTYSNLWLAFQDESGNYYQAASPGFDLVEASEQTTQTLIFDLADFVDNGDPENLIYLTDVGLLEGTEQLGIILGTGTDGGAIYQIDNFRLISEVVDSLPGDFNGDGVVTGRDFLAWQSGDSPNPYSSGDLAAWQAAYNGGALAAVQAVPEPTALVLVLMVGAAFIGRGRCAGTC